MLRWIAALVLLSCGQPAKPAKPPAAALEPTPWAVPPGWRSEVIPFPLGFAPALAHTGVEELRFPEGFLDPASGEYWSYVFVWRTEDPAELDGVAMSTELTAYFRGLVAAVDDKQEIGEAARGQITAHAEVDGTRLGLAVHAVDAFETKQPIELVGWAEREPCPRGALWRFVLAPATTTIRPQLDELARAATCQVIAGRG